MGMIIGGHSHTHQLMSRLSRCEQASEIKICSDFIYKITGSYTECFSYPYGRKSSYNDDTLYLLENSKFQYAFTVDDNEIENSKSIYELARYNCNELQVK